MSAAQPGHPGAPHRPVRFRHNAAIVVAGVVGFIGALPLATARWYLAPILLVPATVALWGWRAGTDATSDGLRVRALLGARRIGWSAVTGLFPDDRGRVFAALDGGGAIRLPAVTAADLPRLIDASGQRPPG